MKKTDGHREDLRFNLCYWITLAIVGFFFCWSHWAAAKTYAQEKEISEIKELAKTEPLKVENWDPIIGSEEKVILNDDFQSGIVRRFFFDPNQEYGVGATVSAFYADGTEKIYWKGWMLRTPHVGEALLLENGKWKIAITESPAPRMSLSALRHIFKKAMKLGNDEILVMDELTQTLIDDKTRKILATVIVYLNKNSANDPNPK